MKTQVLYVTQDGTRSLCMDKEFNLILSINGKIQHIENATIKEAKRYIKELSDYDKQTK